MVKFVISVADLSGRGTTHTDDDLLAPLFFSLITAGFAHTAPGFPANTAVKLKA